MAARDVGVNAREAGKTNVMTTGRADVAVVKMIVEMIGKRNAAVRSMGRIQRVCTGGMRQKKIGTI